jgi:hypothetical protein
MVSNNSSLFMPISTLILLYIMDMKRYWIMTWGWKSLKVYHPRLKGLNPYYNPFFPYIVIPIKTNEPKNIQIFHKYHILDHYNSRFDHIHPHVSLHEKKWLSKKYGKKWCYDMILVHLKEFGHLNYMYLHIGIMYHSLWIIPKNNLPS